MESGVEAQIKYLLHNNLIEQISKKKLNIKGKGRIYNPPKPPSKIFTKVVGNLYRKQFPQESKPKKRIRKVKDKPAGSADVLLKHGKDNGEITQVNADRFSDIINEYDNSQNKQTNPLSVEFKFIIEIKKTTQGSRNDRNVYRTRNCLWWRTGLKIIPTNSNNKTGIYVWR